MHPNLQLPRYLTSYAKATSPVVAGGANDFLFESHENVPVKRITPLKKSPITLLRIVSEKMMLKHGWPMMHEFQSFEYHMIQIFAF
jgi:hypothetical protein